MKLNVGSIDSPDLPSLLQQLKDNITTELNCHRVGQIQTFDAASQTATVTITQAAQVGANVYEFPLLVNVPVFVLSGGVTGVITMPVAAGDTCLVAFHDRDFDNWFATGNTTTPNTPRVHSLTDGMVFVGFRSSANPVSAYSTTAIELRNLGSKLSIGQLMTLTSSLGAQVSITDDVDIVSDNGGVIEVEEKIGISNDATDLRTVLELITAALYALNSAKTGGNVSGSIDAAVLGLQSLLKAP